LHILAGGDDNIQICSIARSIETLVSRRRKQKQFDITLTASSDNFLEVAFLFFEKIRSGKI